MVRFGCRAGFAGLLVLSWLAGCNDSDDAGGAETSRPSAGGGAPSFTTLEASVGRVLVVGESAKVAYFEREYRGLPDAGNPGTDLVRCELTPSSGGFSLSIEAGKAGSTTPQFAARLVAPSLAPAAFEVTGDKGNEAVRVRLGDGDGFSYYEYELDSEGAREASLCSVGLSTFDKDKVVGKAACRRLVATAMSLDATAQGGDTSSGPGTASVTVDFACPFRTLAAPGGGGSGTGGNGGTTNAGNGGNAAAAGQSAGSGGTVGGSGGSAGVEKHCVGSTTACSLRSRASCELGSGCTLDEDCSGFSSSCYGQFSVYSCTAIQGCYWASSTKKCSGSAWSCSSFSGSASCEGQPGCNWSSDCTGVAPLCSGLSEFTCELESGCRWE